MPEYLFGYARVSTREQNLEPQIEALIKDGCAPDKIFQEHISGAKEDRPQLKRLLEQARAGDTIVVWKLDRLARSLKHLIHLSEELGRRKINLRSITDRIDTSTASGELLFHMLGALAQFERSLLRERTRIGLEAAWASGKKSGRKPVDAAQLETARQSLLGGSSVQQAQRASGLGRTTLYRHLDVPKLIMVSKKVRAELGTDLGTKSSRTAQANGHG